MSFADQQVFVTGGSGFIGSHLVETLLAQDAHVTVLDWPPHARLAHLASDPRLKVFEGDIRDAEKVRRLLEKADYVFHLAAKTSVPYSLTKPQETNDINVVGTLNVAVAAADYRRLKGFVFASSCAVYGDGGKTHEAVAYLNPLSPYALQKLSAEGYVRLLSRNNGLPGVSLRFFNVYGPGQDALSSYSGVIAQFCRCMLDGEAPVIYGDGSQQRDFVYVDDVVDAALKAALVAPELNGESFNVGTGDAHSIRQIFDIINGLTGSRIAPQFKPARAGDIKISRAEVSRATLAFKFTATTSILDGLRKTVEFYRRG